ncbi:unnamed protein product, partial [Heterosigma akashiwo]
AGERPAAAAAVLAAVGPGTGPGGRPRAGPPQGEEGEATNLQQCFEVIDK